MELAKRFVDMDVKEFESVMKIIVFVTINRDMQLGLIERAEYGL